MAISNYLWHERTNGQKAALVGCCLGAVYLAVGLISQLLGKDIFHLKNFTDWVIKKPSLSGHIIILTPCLLAGVMREWFDFSRNFKDKDIFDLSDENKKIGILKGLKKNFWSSRSKGEKIFLVLIIAALGTFIILSAMNKSYISNLNSMDSYQIADMFLSIGALFLALGFYFKNHSDGCYRISEITSFNVSPQKEPVLDSDELFQEALSKLH